MAQHGNRDDIRSAIAAEAGKNHGAPSIEPLPVRNHFDGPDEEDDAVGVDQDGSYPVRGEYLR
jgi:hypothetical protein